MQILITNDDGINAPGLEVAYNIAKSLINHKIDWCLFSRIRNKMEQSFSQSELKVPSGNYTQTSLAIYLKK